MEHPAIKDVIVLQTVREEIRHLSTPVYNRLNTILADKTKRFYMFANEHQRWVLDQSQCLFLILISLLCTVILLLRNWREKHPMIEMIEVKQEYRSEPDRY